MVEKTPNKITWVERHATADQGVLYGQSKKKRGKTVRVPYMRPSKMQMPREMNPILVLTERKNLKMPTA